MSRLRSIGTPSLALFCLLAVLFLVTSPVPALASASAPGPAPQAENPDPPAQTVKLIFIHHSTGENWLRDDYGGLGQALAQNNYFVSDTNYGWGPNAIGDSTDIPNWLDWFRSDQSPVYMDALFNESGQNSSYTRLPADPGGENVVIIFKSCFPNSALEGSPNDPPSADGWLSVGHAKYVYNEILQYFASRPDKLFVVITAPPLIDSTWSENARAFNNWLVDDWLAENNYPYNNVAVFDFYNVLTSPDAHHYYQGGSIQHIVGNRNTEYYPSEDDHPSARGSRKATEEFLPLLNIFFNRWASSNTAGLPAATLAAPPETSGSSGDSGSSGVPLPPDVVMTVEDFEGGSSSWQTYQDESGATTLNCAAEQGTGSGGTASLRMDFSIAPGGWATCALSFDAPQDWSNGEWLAFKVHSTQPSLPFNIIVYGGDPQASETYIRYTESPAAMPEDFLGFSVHWDEFLRADWETDGGTPFKKQDRVVGMAFGLDGSQDTPYTGTLWIDDITLQKSSDYTNTGDDTPARSLPCLGSALLPLFVAFAWLLRRR